MKYQVLGGLSLKSASFDFDDLGCPVVGVDDDVSDVKFHVVYSPFNRPILPRA